MVRDVRGVGSTRFTLSRGAIGETILRAGAARDGLKELHGMLGRCGRRTSTRIHRWASSVLSNPYHIACSLGFRGLLGFLSDEQYLTLVYRGMLDKRLDFRNPSTFNEKLQWLKLNDRNPLYVTLVDKVLVKEWVSERIGEEFVVPTYGVWRSASDIDWDNLPQKFVLKCTHDSGSAEVCRDKDSFDRDAASRRLALALRRNYFYYGREWPYRYVEPRIIAEQYLEGEDSVLRDYKMFRFNNGRIVTLVCSDRFDGADMTKSFFDESWQPLMLTRGGHAADVSEAAPTHFGEMKRIAMELGSVAPFVRVDFYESEGRSYFGEFTFYPSSGFEAFDPCSWDDLFGSWISLDGLAES